MRITDNQRGFVTLVAIIIVVIVGLVGTLLYTSLLGEVQGAVGSRQSVGAASVAEAGANWAGNKLAGAGASTYAGDTAQAVNTSGGTQVGVFDVTVTCTDGSAVSTGCSSAPNNRLIAATGYVPNKVFVLGKRKVQIVTAQASSAAMNFAVCGYTSVVLSQNDIIKGNVGSEGAANPDLSLQSGAKIQAGGGLPGNASMVTTANCGTCAGKVAGSVNPNQAAGTVCPNKTNVVNSYTCTPGGTDFQGPSLSISSANRSQYRDVQIQGGVKKLTFVTTGPADVLTVQLNSISGDPGTQLIVQGGGTVQLNVKAQLSLNTGSSVGVDPGGSAVPANHMVVRSCNSGAPDPAFDFNSASTVSGVFIVPNGKFHMNQASLTQGSVLAGNVIFEQDTTFTYDASAQNVTFGSGQYTKLVSWQDVP